MRHLVRTAMPTPRAIPPKASAIFPCVFEGFPSVGTAASVVLGTVADSVDPTPSQAHRTGLVGNARLRHGL
jgi:hypothetical protein